MKQYTHITMGKRDQTSIYIKNASRTLHRELTLTVHTNSSFLDIRTRRLSRS